MQAETPTTPMMAQYLEIKSRYPDAILFYRMGDFYEMFSQDALTAAPILEVQLTARDKSSLNPVPMCGVPYHSAQGYIQRLLAAGHKVAICEQTENAAAAKGLVKRDVVRVLTPALIGDPDLVAPETSQILAAIFERKNTGFEVCLLDLLAGQVRHGIVEDATKLEDLLTVENPREFLLDPSAASSLSARCKELFPQAVITQRPYFDLKRDSALFATNRYLRETQKVAELASLSEPSPLEPGKTLAIDSVSLAALEVISSLRPGGRSLFEVIDRTVTSMGRRHLKDWLIRPSTDATLIEARLGAVENLLVQPHAGDELKKELAALRDLERLNTKTALGLSLPRDLGAIRDTLEKIPGIRAILSRLDAPKLRDIADALDPLPDLHGLLDRALETELPSTLRDGGIIRPSYHPEVERLRHLSRDTKQLLAEMEQRERERSGISSLKFKFSKVFGYTIEVTNTHLSKIPSDYIRKQTIAGGERFITEELKRFEEQLLTAEQKLKTLEESLFLELRRQVGTYAALLGENARLLAEIDVLNSFARIARERDYRRPQLSVDGEMNITEGRHPVVESLIPAGRFVPNSISFDADTQTWIVTGPNMGGKSTIMRQVALISLLAQAGSFVPAKEAILPLLDAIYTRIGSADDLASGRSTFMVEMTEMSRILRRATPNSLILIDEIGRGTSTYDGLSLAWSLLEHIHVKIRAKTLFATHFHEMTSLQDKLAGVRNATVVVREWEGKIIFQYRLVPGVSNRSYGIEVAELAGLPEDVLHRARAVLRHLESENQRSGTETKSPPRKISLESTQLVFFSES